MHIKELTFSQELYQCKHRRSFFIPLIEILLRLDVPFELEIKRRQISHLTDPVVHVLYMLAPK